MGWGVGVGVLFINALLNQNLHLYPAPQKEGKVQTFSPGYINANN